MIKTTFRCEKSIPADIKKSSYETYRNCLLIQVAGVGPEPTTSGL